MQGGAYSRGVGGGRRVLKRKNSVPGRQFCKKTSCSHMFKHGWWPLAVGDWWLVVVGGGWWLVIGGGWKWLAVGGLSPLEVSSWWLVAVGGWQLVVPWAVLKGGPEEKKILFLKEPPGGGGGGVTIWHSFLFASHHWTCHTMPHTTVLAHANAKESTCEEHLQELSADMNGFVEGQDC